MVRTGYWSSFNRIHKADDNSRAGSSHSESNLWDKIWNLHVPPNIKIFTWKAAHDIIGAEANLHSHHVPINPRCVLCASTGPILLTFFFSARA